MLSDTSSPFSNFEMRSYKVAYPIMNLEFSCLSLLEQLVLQACTTRPSLFYSFEEEILNIFSSFNNFVYFVPHLYFYLTLFDDKVKCTIFVFCFPGQCMAHGCSKYYRSEKTAFLPTVQNSGYNTSLNITTICWSSE